MDAKQTAQRRKEHAAKLRENFGGPMAVDEVELLRDMQGFIEFAIRNGLSLPLVISTLGHDVNALNRYGFSLNKAEKDGFCPQVTGYHTVTEEDVGQPAEIE